MKTKILLLAIAIMTSGVILAQPAAHGSGTDAEKKVLKQIKRKMMHINVKDYLVEGERQAVIITCAVNENDEVEAVKMTGYDEELKTAIAETLKAHPVRYTGGVNGNFTFKMVFEYRPA